MHRKWLFLALIAVLVMGSLPLSAIRAQDNTVLLTLAVPSFMKDQFTDELLAKFTDANPGITVQVVGIDPDIPRAIDDVNKHIDGVESYVSKGDVVFVDSSTITQEGTRAGLFLDLSPLVTDDKTLNTDDFYPTMWSAFQWDMGIWALPAGGSTLILTYKPSAFDAAGLGYPSDKWTSDDWANAIQKLTQKDASGKVTTPGMSIGGGPDSSALAISLIGQKLFDDSTIPDTPALDTPAVEKVLATWSQLNKDGDIGSDFNTTPIGIAPAMVVAFQPTATDKRVGIMLPGGKAGLDVEGFAVSAGTPHNAEAYALASFLTTRPEVSGRFLGTPSRKSMAGNAGPGGISVSAASSSDSGSGPTLVGPSLPPDIQALNDQAIANGLNEADLRYVDYLQLALEKMKSDNLDAHSALQLVQTQAVSDEQAAIAKKGTLTVSLTTPVPVVVPPGKTVLKFGLTSFERPIPNEDLWTKLAQDFSQNDPQIGKVNIVDATGDLGQNASQYDCFYMPYNGVPSANLSSLLNLDPYLSADKTFDPSDVVGSILPQLQRDGKTWGLPIMIQPDELQYDADLFNKAGATLPTVGWTVAQFNDALKALKGLNSTNPPFVASDPGGTYLLMLIAAYGGLPLDYRTSPPTINFTDPNTVTAIKQVLDLAKNGYIKYDALGSMMGIAIFSAGGGDNNPPPITSQSFGGFKLARVVGSPPPNPYTPVNYPTGTQFNALSYSIGTAYISANSSNPDACYRWISYIAQHPELFDSMPARRSLINSPSNTPDVISQYNQIDALLKDPKTISFPSMFEGGSIVPTGFIIDHWLFEAFDNYVLHNADLNSALQDAENYAKTFQTCANAIPPYDATSGQSQGDYQKSYLDCASKADSRLQSLVNGLKQAP